MITDAKISSAAKISPAKIAPAQVGQLMVAQADGKYAPVTISGDANLAKDGKLRLKNLDEITERALAKAGEYFNRNEEALKRSDLKKGKTLVGGATTPVEVPVGTGSNAIPQRDSSGNLKAETADSATTATSAASADNADKLDDQDGAHYLDVTQHNYGSAANLDTSGGGIAGTSTPTLHRVVGANNTGQSSPTSYVVEHDLGYEPQVTVLADTDNCGDYYEIDAQVKAETDKVTVDVSVHSVPLKIICS